MFYVQVSQFAARSEAAVGRQGLCPLFEEKKETTTIVVIFSFLEYKQFRKIEFHCFFQDFFSQIWFLLFFQQFSNAN